MSGDGRGFPMPDHVVTAGVMRGGLFEVALGGHSTATAMRSRPWRRARFFTRVLIPLLVLATVTVAGQMTAGASTPTGMLGTTGGFAASGSGCPAGDFAVGAQIWAEGRGYTTGIQLVCRDSLGNTVAAATAGPAYGAVTGSMCSGSDLAVGLYGRAGDVMDAIGIECGSSSGTYGAALAGGTGGGPVGPVGCPAEYVLTSVTVWAGDYFGAPDN